MFRSAVHEQRPERAAVRWLEARRDWGIIFIRAVFGVWLVYGTQDNIFDHGRMVEFQQFIARSGFPYVVALCLLFQGAGPLSVDRWWSRRTQ